MPEYERAQKRLNKPEVILAGDGPSPYGPNSSILNRLIVCQLAKHGAFQYIPGPAKIARVFSEGTYLMRDVDFPDGTKQTFHRVIERHGPQQAIDDPCFEVFRPGLKDLKKRWDALFITGDHTREKQWEVNYFGTNPAAQIDRRERAFEAHVREIGIRIRRLSVTKQLDNSGSSTMNYQFEKLSVLTGKLSKLRVSFTSEAGIVGEFKLDADADRHGIKWDPDKREPDSGTLEERIHCMSKLSGYLEFSAALTPGSTVTFGFSLKIFSGNALSKWEFYQMYGPEKRRHLSGDDLVNEIEYLARIIWIPIEKLKVKIIFPSRVSTPPFLTMFRYSDPEQIPRSAVLDDEGVLHMSPPSGSDLHPKSEQGRKSWSRVDDPLLTEAGMTTLSNTAAQTWELTVSKPLIGTIYSMDWILDNPSPQLDDLAEKARKFRTRLLAHRQERLAGGSGLPEIRECFQQLRSEIWEMFSPQPGEPFEVSVMAYDESNRVLVPVEGTVGEEEFPKNLWDTAIPFGLGLAGSAFKEAELLFRVASPPVLFPFYISLPDRPTHQFLLSAPLDHPEFEQPEVEGAPEPEPVPDRSRQCLGVVNIGSFSEIRAGCVWYHLCGIT